MGTLDIFGIPPLTLIIMESGVLEYVLIAEKEKRGHRGRPAFTPITIATGERTSCDGSCRADSRLRVLPACRTGRCLLVGSNAP